jgi:hypothetical protein
MASYRSGTSKHLDEPFMSTNITVSGKRYALDRIPRRAGCVRESGRWNHDQRLQYRSLKGEIEEFIATLTDPALYQTGSMIGRVESLKLLVDFDDRRPILSFQLGSKRIRRKILDVRQKQDQVLEIQLAHFNQVEQLEIRSADHSTPFKALRASRKSFQQSIERTIQRNFPRVRILTSVVHSDLEHSLSGKYVRLLLSSNHQIWAALAVSPLEDQVSVDGILTDGLIWLDYLRRRRQPGPSQLCLLVPKEREQVLRSRLKWTRVLGTGIVLWLIDVERDELARVDLSDSGNVDGLLTHVSTLPLRSDYSGREDYRHLMALCPEHITPVYRSEANAVGFRIRGLEFATLHLGRSTRLTFGVGRQAVVKSSFEWEELKLLVSEILRQRQPAPPDGRCELYRLQAERWLESLILRDIQLIDPSLDPCFVYPQVPAYLGPDRGMIDILSATKSGRLAVLEIKVSEDIELPLQGLDYWLRVRWHQLRKEFPREGYFDGLQLSPEAPLLYFVCPQFCYHDSFPKIIKYFDRTVPLIQVGINQDWRSGLQVVMRRSFR